MDYNGGTENQNSGNRHKKWYQKTGWIILWLILFFPVGIFLMWRYANWKKPVKIVISAVFAFLIYSGFTASKLESINIQADTETVYNINEQIQIKQVVQPDNQPITATAYKTTGGKVKSSDNKMFFTNDEPGTYEVYAEASGIKSNILTFKIEDKTAILKEKAKKEAAAAKKKAKEEAAAKKAEEERLAAEAEAKKKAEEEAAAKKEEERIAAEAAAKKAEEERIAAEAAAQQAEQERIASEQAAAQAQQPQEQMVWISATGSKYHSYSSCGNMNPDNAYQMTQAEAEASGYGRCKKCY